MVDVSGISDSILAIFPVVTAAAISLIVVVIFYNFIKGQILKLKESNHLDANTAFLLNRATQWLFYLIVAVILFDVLGLQIDFFVGLWVLAGGTIIGFASMNTIGNAIAGLLIMLSRPFKIDDLLFFQYKHVIVEDVDLIYTRMRTMDNVVISVPNQMLLDSVIENQSLYEKIRRRVVVTADYSEPPEKINDLLLKAVNSIDEILHDHPPYVWITDFGKYAMEYTLFYHIASNKRILEIDSKVKKSIVEVFNKNDIDLRTPNLIQSM